MLRLVLKSIFMLAALVSFWSLSGCTAHTVDIAAAPGQKVVRTWYRPDGCFVRRIIYPCYNAQGNLKVQTVRCPDGRFLRRQWVRPDNRCGTQDGFIP